MEDIVSEITAQALNQLAERRVEQSSQEFERAIEAVQLSPEEEAMLAAAIDGDVAVGDVLGVKAGEKKLGSNASSGIGE